MSIYTSATHTLVINITVVDAGGSDVRGKELEENYSTPV